LIVHFLNGTDQQRAWFREAIEKAWSTWADPAALNLRYSTLTALNTRIDVQWAPDIAAPGDDFNALTTTWDDPYEPHALIQIDADLDQEGSSLWQGKEFYLETIVHELAHVAAGRLLLEPQIQRICELLGIPRSQWDTGPWADRGAEATAEIIKVALLQPNDRRYENRTNLRLQTSAETDELDGWLTPPTAPVEWLEFCRLFEEGKTNVFIESTPADSIALGFVGVQEVPGFGDPMGVYAGRLEGLPFVGRTTYTAAVHLTDPIWTFSRSSLELEVFDVNGASLGFNRSALSTVPAVPAIRRTTVRLDTPYLGTQPIGPFEWERLPPAAELRLYALETASLPAEVVVDVTHGIYPNSPLFPNPPFEIVRAKVPSSILALPADPGRRRSDRRIVGAV